MYANPLLIVQVMYSTLKGQSVCYNTRGWFLQILSGEFILHLTIKIHYTILVCRITFFSVGRTITVFYRAIFHR